VTDALSAKLSELTARFRERAIGDRDVIASALARGDRLTLAKRAHKLAGNAGMFGHTEIGQAALDLERLAEAGDDIESASQRLLTLLTAL
jgi:HPt (histidine-containing phosphotransfer) domain-containing protein